MENEQPLYQKVYNSLREKITNGTYKEGDIIPSENELCYAHGVTRPTVRQALDKLVNEGMIYKHHGKGSIVKSTKLGLGILSIESTTAAVHNVNLETKIVSPPIIKPWDENFFYELSSYEEQDDCIYFERQRVVEHQIVLFEKTYLPNINMQGFVSKNLENKSLFDTLRKDYGIEVKGGEQRIFAIKADEDITLKLNVKLNEPILRLQRKISTNKSGFNLYSDLYCNTEKFFLQGSF